MLPGYQDWMSKEGAKRKVRERKVSGEDGCLYEMGDTASDRR